LTRSSLAFAASIEEFVLCEPRMTGVRESGWLYTRGMQSVRLVREETSSGCHLFVYGPGTDVVTHEFANVAECMKGQAEIEQGLLTSGYQLAQLASDRRSETRTWQGSNQRRAAS
jgi:hypothetical protein